MTHGIVFSIEVISTFNYYFVDSNIETKNQIFSFTTFLYNHASVCSIFMGKRWTFLGIVCGYKKWCDLQMPVFIKFPPLFSCNNGKHNPFKSKC